MVEEASREKFEVAYDGDMSTDKATPHSMDVRSLGPALTAFGRLIEEANTAVNGKNAQLRLLVASEFEHKCFSISFEAIQTYTHEIIDFLRDLKTVKDILQALGLLPDSRAFGLFEYLNWKNRSSVAETVDTVHKELISVRLTDDRIALVRRDALDLSKSPKIRRAIENTLNPLGMYGIKTIKFVSGGTIYNEVSAKQIIASFDIPTDYQATDEASDEENTETVWLKVRSPVYDTRSKKWDFFYKDRKISVDISGTSILATTLERGGALINDRYKVRLKSEKRIGKGGSEIVNYYIVEVLDFDAAARQIEMPLGPGKP